MRAFKKIRNKCLAQPLRHLQPVSGYLGHTSDCDMTAAYHSGSSDWDSATHPEGPELTSVSLLLAQFGDIVGICRVSQQMGRLLKVIFFKSK